MIHKYVSTYVCIASYIASYFLAKDATNSTTKLMCADL